MTSRTTEQDDCRAGRTCTHNPEHETVVSVHAPTAQPPSRTSFTLPVASSGLAHGGGGLSFGPRPRFHPAVRHVSTCRATLDRDERALDETSQALHDMATAGGIHGPRTAACHSGRRIQLRSFLNPSSPNAPYLLRTVGRGPPAKVALRSHSWTRKRDASQQNFLHQQRTRKPCPDISRRAVARLPLRSFHSLPCVRGRPD